MKPLVYISVKSLASREAAGPHRSTPERKCLAGSLEMAELCCITQAVDVPTDSHRRRKHGASVV